MDHNSQTLGSTPKFARKYHNRVVQRTGCTSCSERGKALPPHVKDALKDVINNLKSF